MLQLARQFNDNGAIAVRKGQVMCIWELDGKVTVTGTIINIDADGPNFYSELSFTPFMLILNIHLPAVK